MKCIICGEREATVPDRNSASRRKMLCGKCHSGRLTNDLQGVIKKWEDKKREKSRAEKVFHEKKIKTLERVISDIWDIVGECGDSGDTDKLSRIETRLLDYEIEAYDGPE